MTRRPKAKRIDAVNDFRPMVYVGPWEGLEGREALVRPSTQPGKVLAQFEDVGQRTGKELAGVRDVTELEQLMFGWHEFPEGVFDEGGDDG